MNTLCLFVSVIQCLVCVIHPLDSVLQSFASVILSEAKNPLPARATCSLNGNFRLKFALPARDRVHPRALAWSPVA